MYTTRNRVWITLLPAAGLLGGATLHAATPEQSHVDISIADRFTYDDNLFRLPEATAAANLPPDGDFKRDDSINRATLALDALWLAGSQKIDLTLAANDNRYSRNDDLDHVSGNGRFLWDWRTAGDWSGHLGATYDRSLASFANTRIFIRDLLDTYSYFGDVRLGLGARWAVKAGAARIETTHSAEIRELDDYQGDIGTFSIEYLTPASTLLGFDYRHAVAGFPGDVFLGGTLLERDFTEDTAGIHIRYALTGKTTFDGTAGYLSRDYDNPDVNDFDGDVWRLSLDWRPGVKTQILLSGWRELKAYADVESDYFKGTGVSIAPTWMVTDKFKLSFTGSWEQQDYLGSSLNRPASIAREDTVEIAQLQATYAPREPLELTISYRQEQRDSNRPTFVYDDGLAAVGLKFVF